MPIDVKKYLSERRAACAAYDPIAEFGHANMSLNQSLLSRWPDIEAKRRHEHVRAWYGRLRERMSEHMKSVFGDDSLPELRALYVKEALESAVRHTTTGDDPTERTEAEEYFEKALRSRTVQVMRVLFEIDDELEAVINIDELASPSGWLQCAWGQHGAHFPDGSIPV
jgi:hypothetical protein